MKICATCSTKPMRKKIQIAKMEKFFNERLPKSIKTYHQSSTSTYHIKMKGLKPNSYIFYFGTQSRDFRKPILKMDTAYGKLQNSGVVKTDKKGCATFYLKCPQIYHNESNNKVYSRHFHFLYWNKKKSKWSRRVLTESILCDIHQNDVKKLMKSKNVVVIDALPEEYHCQGHIPGAIHLPHNKHWSEKEVMKRIRKTHKNFHKLSPIIVYCYSKKCNAAHKVYERLNKMGFYNTLHYVDGISKWKGKKNTCSSKK